MSYAQNNLLIGCYAILNTGLQLYNSMYEVFQALTVVAKQHFVHYFVGKSLGIIWTTNLGGSGTVTMTDAIDGGMTLQDTGTSSTINMNNKREFVHNACTMIIVMKTNFNASESEAGFMGDITYTTLQSFALVGIEGSTSATNYALDTEDGTTESITASSTAADANFHTHKIVCGSANVKYYIDGVLVITKTTNLPLTKMQPGIVAKSRSATTGLVTILSMEAMNN